MKLDYDRCALVDAEKCKGCTNCVKICPSEAIRVRDGTSITLKDKCIQCGTCFRTCPYHAKIAITDPMDLDRLKEFKCTIALVSPVLYAQFDKKVSPGKIFNALISLGFDKVFEEGIGAEAYTIAVKEYLKKPGLKKPLISTSCPSVLNLIKLRFPNLVDNIIPLNPPMEITAKLVRTRVSQLKNIPENEIGIFMITPCVAKAMAIQKPIGLVQSNLNGAISLLHAYGLIVKKVHRKSDKYNYPKVSGAAIGFAKSGGEISAISPPSYLVADGLKNVVSLLEEIDKGNFDDVDYIECHICYGGSIGGPLTCQNNYRSRVTIRNLVKQLPNTIPDDKIATLKRLYDEGFYDNNKVIKAHPITPLDPDINRAIELVATSEEILKQLPSLDCGSCGTPSCRALAEDVALGRAKISDCIFKMLQIIEQSAKSTLDLLHKANRF